MFLSVDDENGDDEGKSSESDDCTELQHGIDDYADDSLLDQACSTEDETDVTDNPDSIITDKDCDETLSGSLGSDILYGEDGSDLIYSSVSPNLFLGTGTVAIAEYGDDANDQLFGGNGDDILVVSDGDSAFGGAGSDVVRIVVNDGVSLVELGDFAVDEDELHILLETTSEVLVGADVVGFDGELIEFDLGVDVVTVGENLHEVNVGGLLVATIGSEISPNMMVTRVFGVTSGF